MSTATHSAGPRLPRHHSRDQAANDTPETVIPDELGMDFQSTALTPEELSEFREYWQSIVDDEQQGRSAYMQGWRWGAWCGAFAVALLVLLAIAAGSAAGWLQ